MAAAPPVQSFRFETEYDLSDVTQPRPRLPRRTPLGLTEDQILIAFGLVGAILLFWKFTISLGAGILAMGTFLWAMRERSQEVRKRYEHLREPRGRVRVGASESGYWIRGEDFSAEAAWTRVVNAIELDEMLTIHSWTMPRVRFPVHELRDAGVYDAIHALVDERSAAHRARMDAARAARG